MGFLNKLLGSKPDAIQTELEAKGFEASSCSETCDECSNKFPSSLKFDTSAQLWNSTNPYGCHIVVATGKTDWPHDATGTSGTLAHAVAKFASSHESDLGLQEPKIKVTVGSISSPQFETNDAYVSEKVGDLLILPFFVKVRGLAIDQVTPVLSRLIPQLAQAARSGNTYPETTYNDYPQVQIEVDHHDAHIFLCSHRTRDKRCGVTAPIMKREMDIHLRDLGLSRDVGDDRPGGVGVSFINHIGGHKYAANVIIYLKKSGKLIWLARCTPNNVKPIIDECVVGDGKVWPDKVRIVQKFDPIAW